MHRNAVAKARANVKKAIVLDHRDKLLDTPGKVTRADKQARVNDRGKLAKDRVVKAANDQVDKVLVTPAGLATQEALATRAIVDVDHAPVVAKADRIVDADAAVLRTPQRLSS